MLNVDYRKAEFRAQTLQTEIQRDLLSYKSNRMQVYELDGTLLGFCPLQNTNFLSGIS